MNKFRDIIQRIKERKEIIPLMMNQTEITPDNGFAYRYFLCKILGDRWEGEFMPSQVLQRLAKKGIILSMLVRYAKIKELYLPQDV